MCLATRTHRSLESEAGMAVGAPRKYVAPGFVTGLIPPGEPRVLLPPVPRGQGDPRGQDLVRGLSGYFSSCRLRAARPLLPGAVAGADTRVCPWR